MEPKFGRFSKSSADEPKVRQMEVQFGRWAKSPADMTFGKWSYKFGRWSTFISIRQIRCSKKFGRCSTKFGRWSMQIWQVERKFGIPGHSIFYLL